MSWLANQRRATTLTPEQLDALALIGWTDNARQAAWEARCEQLRAFVREHHRAPRVNGPLPGESTLAHWHSRQRVALNSGTLSRDRKRALEYATRALSAP